jgi:hypothetical protein
MALPPLFHIREKLGAVQIAGVDGPTVQFRLFFAAGFHPHIASILVAGTFQSKIEREDWKYDGALSLTQTTAQEGEFWTLLLNHDLPTGFYEYKY